MLLANLSNQSSRLLVGCALLALSACATNKELTNQLASSREAVDQARMAGAEQTAGADMNVAIAKLERADAAAKNRDEKDAMRLAQQAQVDANLARARSESAQARVAATEVMKSNQIMRAAATNRANQNQ
jgi:hypothetical protein